MNIKLNDGQIDEVVLFETKRHSKLLKQNIVELKKRKKNLKKFEKEDLQRFEEVAKALDIVVGYYGS